MTGRRTLLLLLAPTILLVAACGEQSTPYEDMTKAERATAVPFAGRDDRHTTAAFPDDDRDVLEQADRITLYTLNPTRMVDGKPSPEKERFHLYGVLGTTSIEDASEHRRVVEAVYEGLKGEGAGPASCFLPRHGLRFERGKRRIDLLICFQCTWVYVFRDDAEHETRMLFGAGVKPVFDSIVKTRALPQDGDPK